MNHLSRKSLSLAVLAGLAVAAVWSSAEAARRGGGRGRSIRSSGRSGGSFRRSGGSSFRRSGRTGVSNGVRGRIIKRGSSIGSRVRTGVTSKGRGNIGRRIGSKVGQKVRGKIGSRIRGKVRSRIGGKIRKGIVRRGVGRRIAVSSQIRSSRRIWRKGFFWHHRHRHWGLGRWGRRFYFGFVFARPVGDYYNPYCGDDGFFPVDDVCDYSQPIVDDGQYAEGGFDDVNNSGDAFLQGDYETALAQADKAAKEMPNNPDVHQYRSLILFAMGRYQEAAAAAHSALVGGPGWNWDTLKAFYSDTSVYTQQLRALEKHTTENLNDSFGRFLLGYHYMMLGHADSAGKELTAVVALQPKDSLSAELLKSISAKTGKTYTAKIANENDEEQGDGEQSLPPLPPTGTEGTTGPAKQPAKTAAKSLVGTWKAVRENNLTITLDLKADGSFVWNIDADGQKVDVKGTFKFAGNQLTLDRTNGPALEGTVEMKSKDEFKFTPDSSPENDPGFVFKKQ